MIQISPKKMPELAARSSQWRGYFARLGLMLLMAVTLPSLGCGMADEAALGGDFASEASASPLLDAQAALARHKVDEAQSIYNQIIATSERPPARAYAGKAICDLLLLPGSAPASRLLTNSLAASTGVDANAAIYADEGFLYWLARGVPWTDKGTYSGIRTLISARMPWPQARLENTRAFFEVLGAPLTFATDDLAALADAMAQIQADLDRAAADPNFEPLYIPGALFHSDQLDLFLGRAELHLLSGLVSGARAAIYFMAAYTYDFSLDALLGSQSDQRQQPRPGWSTADYAMAFLDGHFLRSIRDPARLEMARVALDAGLSSAILAVEAGMDQTVQTSLAWQEGRADYAAVLVEFLAAIRASLHARTPLPGASPKTTLDLSSFFDAGRVLDPSIDWFERVSNEPQTGSEPAGGDSGYWDLTSQAGQTFLVDGVVAPPVDLQNPELTLTAFDDERASLFFEAVLGPLLNSAGASY